VADISMPGLNGIDAIRRIRKGLPNTRFLVLSVHSDMAYVEEAFEAGSHGYVLKRSAAGELATGIRQVLKGRIYLTPLLKHGEIRPPPKRLTLRQLEVLKLVVDGKQNKEIAQILGISLKTVEFHKNRIMNELDIHTPAGLTRYALERGIVES
jgi:DNA-binding NarL/FixJ family response regulator